MQQQSICWLFLVLLSVRSVWHNGRAVVKFVRQIFTRVYIYIYIYIRWYHHVSNWEVRCLTEQPPLTTIIQKRSLTLFGHLVRMDESADARRILTAVPQSEWRRPVGRPYTFWMATLKHDLSLLNLTLEDAIKLALNKQASGATHWWCMPNNDDDDV